MGEFKKKIFLWTQVNTSFSLVNTGEHKWKQVFSDMIQKKNLGNTPTECLKTENWKLKDFWGAWQIEGGGVTEGGLSGANNNQIIKYQHHLAHWFNWKVASVVKPSLRRAISSEPNSPKKSGENKLLVFTDLEMKNISAFVDPKMKSHFFFEKQGRNKICHQTSL